MNPLFSVIVASYNYANLIGETLDSLLAQTYQDYEIIIVDDGSSDNSLSVIDKYMRQSDKIKLYTHPNHQNKGLIETIKLGIQMSSGEYIAFCESDDLWMPEHLEEQAKVIQEYGNVFIISNDVEVFGQPESIKIRKKYVQEIKEQLSAGPNHISLDTIREFNIIPTFSCVTIKKWLFNYINFNSPIPAWIDFWVYRQILQRYDLYFLPQKLTRWRMHDSYNDPTKDAEYTKHAKEFMEKSNKLIFYPQDKYFFTVTKNLFHHSKSWSETLYFLKSYQKVSHDKELRKKIWSKFIWYRVLQFWRNHSWKKYTGKSIDYSSFLPTGTSHQKKILLFSHEMSITGAPRALCALAEALKKNGCYPVIISPSQNEMEEETERLDIPVIVDSLLKLKLYQRDEALYNFINRFDVLFFNTIDVCLHYAQYLPNLKQKKVAWIHEGETSFRLAPTKDIEEAFSLLDNVYTVGEYSKSFALPYTNAPEKVKTLLYGCPDITVRQEQESQGDLVPHTSKKLNILIIGTIDRRKGMHLINKALDEMSSTTLGGINVTIVGSSVSKSITASLKTSKYKCLHYLGPRSHQEVVSILNNCDILLCPSLDDPMPIVCTEAMILQKVIIVSDHTGTASFIRNGENGFVIPAGSPQAIANAIETAMKQREDFAKIGKEARKIYEQYFTMEVFEKNIKEIFIN